MKLTKRGEVVLAIGVATTIVLIGYVAVMWVRFGLLVWSLRGYDLR